MVPTRFHELCNQHAGVVVAMLPALLKLPRFVQQFRYRATPKGVEQSQFQGAGDVKGEFIASEQIDNALAVCLGIQLADFLPDLRGMKNTPRPTIVAPRRNLGTDLCNMKKAGWSCHGILMDSKEFIITAGMPSDSDFYTRIKLFIRV